MEKRRYKNTDEYVSLLGFGCMRLPQKNSVTKRVDRKRAQKMVDFAVESGINYFDTAYIYHLGDSENFIGDALKRHPRDKVNLADKLPVWFLRKEEDVDKYFDKQLRKCGVEYFDYYLMHSLKDASFSKVQKLDIYAKLKKKQEEGKIRRLGFSFHDNAAALKKFVDEYDWDFAQIQLNYLDWEGQDARGQYKVLADKGVPAIIMEPCRGGMLANLNKTSEAIFKEAAPDKSSASWAIRYAASLPNVLTVLSGMSNMEQLEDNINTMTNFKPLSEEEYKVINKAATAIKQSAVIPCTACEYCLPCPAGVNIPKAFTVYNSYITNGNIDTFKDEYSLMAEKERPDSCTKCGKCMKNCPQAIKIPDNLQKIQRIQKEERL